MFERALPTSTEALQALASSLIAELARKDELLAMREQRIGQHEQQIAQHVQSIEERDRALAASLQELSEANALAEKLKFELARYRRWRFGKKSEALSADQIALWEAELDADIEAIEQRLENLQDKIGGEKPAPKRTPKRQALPATLPRLEEILEPETTTCCGATMTRIGEDVAETLEMIPSRFWVRRRIRGKWACRCCERIAMAPVESAPIDKGVAGASVLANVVVSKFVDHLPLHRQEAIYTRMGVAIPRSTMAGWLGRIGVSVQPLVELLAEHVIGSGGLQADETPVPVLDPGSGKTATGYLWAYRTLPSAPVQAVVFDFAASRSQVHPNRMLARFAGTLQVDGYAGYNEILRKPTVTEAGCWAHARRKLVDVFEATKSPVAQEAIRRIAALYKIEHEIDEAGEVSPLERSRLRESRAGPLLEELHRWLVAIHAKSAPRGSLAKAIQYTLNRWAALTQFVKDGRLPLDTNAVENAIRPIALGRRNWLFAGSEAGGVRAAQIYSLLGSARLAGVPPLDYITDVLQRMPTARRRDLEALLPWNWKPSTTRDIAAELCAPPLPLILVPN
ncbi:MAG: IS66 family transposase [Anaerolineae bacterium]|nr:IS66 family transposase [Anaerolineae bacterium]